MPEAAEIAHLIETVQFDETRRSRAVADLVRTYGSRVYALCCSILGPGAEAEDAAQETWITAISRIASLAKPGSFPAWLYSIARTKSYSRARAIKQETSLETAAIEIEAPAFEDWNAVRDALRFCVACLPPAMREAVRLFYFTGMSIKAIAKASGTTEGAVKTALYSARKKLAANSSMFEDALCYYQLNATMEDTIMTKTEAAKTSAYFLERLSLSAQLELADAVGRKEKWGERIVREIAECENGSGWMETTHAFMTLDELVETLNWVDRATEARIITALSERSPETAERIKASMFVFEDLTLCDAKALERIMEETGTEPFMTALSDVREDIRQTIFSRLDAGMISAYGNHAKQGRKRFDEVEESRRTCVKATAALEEKGVLVISRKPEGGTIITVG